MTATQPHVDAACEARDQQLAAWVQRAATGDARAFEAFYDATIGATQSLLRRMLRADDVEDVLADGYFQAWRDAARFDPMRGRAISWLLTILRSRALDLLRRQRLQPVELDEGETADISDDVPGPADLALQAQESGRLQQALGSLGAQERWLLGLAYYRDLSHARIAETTGLPLGTVKSLILRAQHKLRDALAEPAA
ncbi:MAG: RNA polymerase sigma factor [Aquabacterium sp.]